MLKGLGSLLIRSLLLFLLSTPAWAGSTLYLDSQTGDTVGGGHQVTYTDNQGAFTISGKLNTVVQVNFFGNSSGPFWNLDFVAPSGATLAAGNYDGAQRYPLQSPVLPGLNVSGPDFCNTLTGYFVVRAVTTDGSGNVTSLAVDFEQQCAGASGALYGAIRYNSTLPYPVDAPTANAGSYQIVAPGDTVTVDGSLSEPGNGSIAAYIWTQLSGPTVTFADASAVTTSFTAPAVGLGGADVVLQLEVDNSLSLSSTATVTIHVANPADPVTAFNATSDAGFNGATAKTYSVGPLQALFTTATPVFGGTGVEVDVNGGSGADWRLDFLAPKGQTLQVGAYDYAAGYPGQPVQLPGMQIVGCNNNLEGRFVILYIQTDVNGKVTSFAADFEQHCNDQAPAFHGTIRFNSTIPPDAPLADAGTAQVILQGEPVTLNGSTWSPGGDGNDITSYQWVQISGLIVTLSDANAADPTFTAPDVTMGGSDLVFQLTVTNSLGFSSTSTVTVHVTNPADAMTLLQIKTTPAAPGDPGVSLTITSAQQSFAVSEFFELFGGGVLNAAIGGFAPNNWGVTVGPPYLAVNVLPSVGSHLVPEHFAAYGTLAAGGPDNFVCNGSVSGHFTILDLQTDVNNNVTSTAADFDEFCSNSAAALHGKLRFNSTVALDTPDAIAGGRPQEAAEGSLVTLPGGISYSGSDSEDIVSYQWTQLAGVPVSLSDPTAAAPTFTAPNVPAGGSDLVFQLTVTNSNGLTGTDTTTVHVPNPVDPRTLLHIESDAGDPIGHGQTYDYNELNAVFEAPPVNGAGKGVSVAYGPESVWSMQFAPILGQALHVGAYDQAQSYSSPEQITALPGLSVTDQVSNQFYGCGVFTASFDILDIQTDQFGNITSLAADFVQTCVGATGSLHGQLRYNSAVPLNVPFADTGVAQLADPGNVITLGGSSSYPGADGATISSYQWVQVSGPSVTLSDPTGATTSFTSPNVPLGGADLVFQLTVTNSNGVSSTSTVTVHVGNRNDLKTRLYIKSDPNDPIAQGGTYDLQTTNAVFGISALSGGGTANNTIRLTANPGTETNWTLDFAAPVGQALHAGTRYPLAQSYPFQAANVPGLLVFPGFESCVSATGLFIVRDLQIAQDGSVTSFAADFVQHCFGEPPAAAGWIRYNSTVPMDTPIADAGIDQFTYSGLMPVTLDGSATRIGLGGTLTYDWTQIVAKGDPTVSLTDPTVAKPMFLTPDVPLGGRKLVFQLTALNGFGQTDTATVNVTVGNENDPKSAFYYESDPGDPVGQGTNGFGAGGAIFLSRSFVGGFDAATFELVGQTLATTLGVWDFSFQKSDAGQLQTGIYTVGPGGGFILPSMSVSDQGTGTCNSPTGLFIVRDIAYDSQERIASMGVDFVQHCDGATGDLRGALRYNSKTPILINEPTANPGPNQSITQPGTITLDGSASFPGWGTIISYQWVQIAGPHLSLSGANSAQASFNLPTKLLGNGGNILKFQLTVKNSLGLSSSNVVTLTAAYPDTNLLFLQSDPGDPVGQGFGINYAPADKAIKVGRLGNTGVSAAVTGVGNWTLDFSGPGRKTALQVGSHPNALLYRAGMVSGSPTLFVGTAPGQCKTVTGDFTVLDVVYGSGNAIQTLAVDFDQHCNGIGPALHGKLRYHSNLP